jgi:hypothetical protein
MNLVRCNNVHTSVHIWNSLSVLNYRTTGQRTPAAKWINKLYAGTLNYTVKSFGTTN